MKTIGDYKTEFMDNHFVRARIHYAHAKKKHPYFADEILDSVDTPDRMAQLLRIDRDRLKLYAKLGCVRPIDVLECEVSEVMCAISNGDNAAAVEELYDCVAVLLRTIDVLEGRQNLGKPETISGNSAGIKEKGITKNEKDNIPDGVHLRQMQEGTCDPLHREGRS